MCLSEPLASRSAYELYAALPRTKIQKTEPSSKAPAKPPTSREQTDASEAVSPNTDSKPAASGTVDEGSQKKIKIGKNHPLYPEYLCKQFKGTLCHSEVEVHVVGTW